MTQIAGFMLSTRLQMVTGEASASLRTPLHDSLSVCSHPISPVLSFFFPAPSVYICSALSSFDNDPVMGLSKSKVAIVCGLSVSIDHSAVEKPFAYHGLPFVER